MARSPVQSPREDWRLLYHAYENGFRCSGRRYWICFDRRCHRSYRLHGIREWNRDCGAGLSVPEPSRWPDFSTSHSCQQTRLTFSANVLIDVSLENGFLANDGQSRSNPFLHPDLHQRTRFPAPISSPVFLAARAGGLSADCGIRAQR
jgi:hypothetical protein